MPKGIRGRTPCSVDGCDDPVSGRGWCDTHLSRWRRRGDPGTAERKLQRYPADATCRIEGCQSRPFANWLCVLHRSRAIGKSSVPLEAPRRNFHSPAESLAARTVVATSGCHEYTGSRSPRGYGQVYRGRGKRPYHAHRLAWELAHGPIPAGMHILHTCDNPPCVNPAHLSLGTHADNMADMARKGRAGDRRAVA